MATERELELLDDYLANRLTGEEMASFEQRLQADPELRSEMQLQQQLISGIRKARATQLKAMLNNIPVSSIPQTGGSAALKFAMGGLVAGAVVTGIYFLAQDKEENVQIKSEQQAPVKTEADIKTPVVDESTPALEKPLAEKSENIAEERENRTENASKKSQTESTPQPHIEVFDPTEEVEGTASQTTEMEAPPSSVGRSEPSVTVSVDKNNREFNFHYQFKDDKLFLYGPFETNLYEIMEFFTDKKRTIFLFHKEKYYLLKEQDESIKNLLPITDPILIKKLDETRSN